MLKKYFEKELKQALDQFMAAEERNDTNSKQFYGGQIYALNNAAKALGFNTK